MSDDNQKVPSQIFVWFEKIKSNYEHSVDITLKRFENFNGIQQKRLDKSNNSHIDNLKEVHLQQIKQSNENISRLQDDINYYKQQVSKQQQTIEQLNSRYDAVMNSLLHEKSKELEIKDFYSTSDAETPDISALLFEDELNHSSNSMENNTDTDSDDLTCDDLYEQAVNFRKDAEYSQAFLYFEQAAHLNNSQAMCAMGKAYFLGEGVEKDPSTGLAWLINAANNNLPHAITRVNDFKENDPELYQQALLLIDNL